MQRLPVESSDIVSIGYEPAESILEVEFRGGRIYQYREVEPDIYAQFMRADSYGTFFFAHVNGRYRYKKVNEADSTTTGDQSLAAAGLEPTEAHSLQIACEPYDILVEPLDVPLDEIQSDNLEDITLKKAKQAFKLANQPVVVRVVSWNIIAMRGFPGVYAGRIARWLTADELLLLLQDKTDRTISITYILTYYDGKRHKNFKQDLWGQVGNNPKGQGHVFEQLVTLTGQDKTLAELRETADSTWGEATTAVRQELAKWLRLQRRLRLF